MRKGFYLWPVLAMLTLAWVESSRGIGQEREFKDPSGQFSLTLREGWEPVTYKDGAGNTVTDIIFENRERGILRVRQKHVDRDMTPEAFCRRQQNASLRFRPGFTRNALEPFSNRYYEGAVLSFDFTYGGRPKTARYYYLKIDHNSFYVLQFEGAPEVLRTMRNRTDLMARSFRLLS